EHVLSQAADVSIATLIADENRPDGSTVTIAGLITSLQRKMSKKGNPWAIVTIEDLEGSVDVMFFGETYLAYSTALAQDQVVSLKGRVRWRDETMSLQAMEMSLPDVSVGQDAPVAVRIPESRCSEPVLTQLRDVLVTHPGGSEVHVHLTSPGRSTVMRLEDALRVERPTALQRYLRALPGPRWLAGGAARRLVRALSRPPRVPSRPPRAPSRPPRARPAHRCEDRSIPRVRIPAHREMTRKHLSGPRKGL